MTRICIIFWLVWLLLPMARRPRKSENTTPTMATSARPKKTLSMFYSTGSESKFYGRGRIFDGIFNFSEMISVAANFYSIRNFVGHLLGAVASAVLCTDAVY